MTGLERLEALIRRLRSTSFGEAFWLIGLSACLSLHVVALAPAFAVPHLADYQSYLTAAQAWMDGQPYPPGSTNPNAPHLLIAYVPLLSVSLRVGLAISTLLNYAGLIGAFALLGRALKIRVSPALGITLGLVVLAAPPSSDVFSFGNTAWALAAVFTLAWAVNRAGRPVAGAVLLGLLATVKPFVLGYALLYLARRQWRPMATMLAAATLTLAGVIVILGWPTFAAWIRSMQEITWYGMRANSSFMGVLARSWKPEPVVWLVLSAIVTGATYFALRRDRDNDADWLVVLVACLLIGPLGWRYYLCFALGPLAGVLLTRASSPLMASVVFLAAIAPTIPLRTAAPWAMATIASLPFYGLVVLWSVVIGRRVLAGDPPKQPAEARV